MQDLTLVGMHDDGERLLLTTATGDRFTLAVDDALRAAVRGDRPRLGQLQTGTDRLRPRDVQARIRAGHTAEEVAATADVPLDYVRRYEGPVLAERAYVAGQARRVQIRRGALAAATTPTLGDLVDERLRRREVDPDQTVWDAWRADDGTWTVQADFPVGAKRRHARWTYNPPLRQVTPLDDESRWLTDGDGRDRDRSARPRSSAPGTEGAPTGPRLVVAPPVDDGHDVGTDEHDTGPEGTIDLTLGSSGGQESDAGPDLLDALVESDPSTPSLELLDSLRERRGRRIRVADETDGDGDDPVETAIESILALRRPTETEPLPSERDDVPPATAPRPAPPSSRTSGQPKPGPAGRPAPPGSRHPAGKARARTSGAGPDATLGTGDPSPARPRPRPRAPQRTIEVPPPTPPVASPTAATPTVPTPTPSATGSTSGDRTAADDASGGAATPVTPRKPRRASVPSWDEIILGGRRD